MSNQGKLVSKSDHARWLSPLTTQGHRVREAALTLRVHDAGCIRLGREWDHRGVCSPYWRLYHNFEVGSAIRVAERRWPLTPRSVLLVPEGVRFDCQARSPVRHLWIHFSLRPLLSNEVVGVTVDRSLAALLEKTATLLARRAPDPGAVLHGCTALIHATLAETAVAADPEPPRLRELTTWLETSLGRALDNRVLAAHAGMSVEAFIRWFRRHTGRTPAAYVAEQRVREACRRLAFTDDSIERVAEAVGFANRHHFSRVFKRHAGTGPAAFRSGQRVSQ